jgi:hypothetical protein
MKPIPIPDNLIPEGYYRATVGAPKGQEQTVMPVEVIRPNPKEIASYPKNVLLIEVTKDDLERLQTNGGLMWLQFIGTTFNPFSLDVV